MKSKTAERIRNARKAAGLTQADLARLLRTTQQQVSMYETGEQDPTVSRLIEISNAIGVRPSDLIDG